MADDNKGQPGLFRLKDLEAMEIDDQPLFPASQSDDRSGLVSAVAAEEMVAAIRRARDLHSQEHDPRDLPPEVSGIHSLIMESPPGGLPALEEDLDETGDHIAALSVEDLQALGKDGAEPQRSYRTAQTHAVIKAAEAEAERTRRSTGALVLMVVIPLLLVAVTAAVVVVVLTGESPLSEARFPVRAVAVTDASSELASVDLMTVPEPEPEPAAEPERDEAAERRERRERRRHEREREREREIDRDDLF